MFLQMSGLLFILFVLLRFFLLLFSFLFCLLSFFPALNLRLVRAHALQTAHAAVDAAVRGFDVPPVKKQRVRLLTRTVSVDRGVICDLLMHRVEIVILRGLD